MLPVALRRAEGVDAAEAGAGQEFLGESRRVKMDKIFDGLHDSRVGRRKKFFLVEACGRLWTLVVGPALAARERGSDGQSEKFVDALEDQRNAVSVRSMEHEWPAKSFRMF